MVIAKVPDAAPNPADIHIGNSVFFFELHDYEKCGGDSSLLSVCLAAKNSFKTSYAVKLSAEKGATEAIAVETPRNNPVMH